MNPQPEPVHHQHITLTVIYDPILGTYRVPTAAEDVTIDPVTNNRTIQVVTGLVRCKSGRIWKLEETLTCRECNDGGLLAPPETRFCGTCGCALCAAHAGIPPFCRRDRWRDRLNRFVQWATTR